MCKSFFLSFFLCFISFSICAQTSKYKSDSLSTLDYSKLKKIVDKNKLNALTQNLYLSAFIKKAKTDKDTLQLCIAYKQSLIYEKDNHLKIKYADSILMLSEDEKFHNINRNANFLKALCLYNISNYEYALALFLKTKKLNKLRDYDEEFDLIIDYNIGLLKNRIGDYTESLKIFKKYYNYYQFLNEPSYSIEALPTIVDVYINLKNIDSAAHYNNILKKQITSLNDKDLYPFYLINQGVILSNTNKNNQSIDSINKSVPLFQELNDKHNLQFCYYYFGVNYNQLNKKNESVKNFKKMDSIFLDIKDIHPNVRNGYEFLIKHYKKEEDINSELLYLNRLLEVDSVLNIKHKTLADKILKEFDTPILLEEKQKIIKRLSKQKHSSNNYLKLASIFIFTLIFFSFYYYLENKKNKEKFKLLIKNEGKTTNSTKLTERQVLSLNINQHTVDLVINKLEEFKNLKGYISESVSLNSLAKEFNTNSKYLSQIINYYEKKNFSNYINDLRISYVVNKLKEDKQFRNYTIKAIGKEVGFNSAESFSKAFYKVTKIKPSYFLKELSK